MSIQRKEINRHAQMCVSDTYSHEEKKTMYEAGKYVMQVPPVITTEWSLADWFRWIETSGGWRP